MPEIFRGYIQTQNKRSVQRFREGEPLLTPEEADAFPEFAGVLNGKFTVIDIDDKAQAELVLKIVTDENLNCRVYRTPRGYHFAFASADYVSKNRTHQLCALGVEVDVRCGRTAYILLKQDGAMREVVREFDESRAADKVPRWLAPLANAKSFIGMAEGDGRNSALFAYLATLTQSGFTKEEAKKTAMLINRYIFKTPLPDDELAQILRDEAFENLMPKLYAPEALPCGASLKELHPEQNPRYAWTDIGASRLFADYFKSIARYVPERKLWYCHDGKRWMPDTGNLKVMELCKRLADELLVYATTLPDERQRSAYIDYCRKWQIRRNRETILKDAQSVYPIAMSEFDSDPYVLNCRNGTLFLKTMEFKAHNSDDLLTKISGAKYDPDARCERWDSYIDEIMLGNEQNIRFLQKSLGYTLSGDTSRECMFIFYGAKTRNGKGTLAESVLRVMGDYGCTVRPESISLKQNINSTSPTEDIARLAGVRFVNISEPGKGLVLNAAQVKSMTGGDSINARFLHENSFDYLPQFKIYINANFLPIVNDMTLFTSGRIIIIPFERHFSENEQDTTLKREFAKPKVQSAILNWLVEGYRLLLKEGLIQPPSVLSAISDYRHDSDKITQFIEEALVPQKNAEERTAEVYARYQRWCEDAGYRTENMRNFKQALCATMRIERKRPKLGGSETTMLVGYRLTADDGILPL